MSKFQQIKDGKKAAAKAFKQEIAFEQFPKPLLEMALEIMAKEPNTFFGATDENGRIFCFLPVEDGSVFVNEIRTANYRGPILEGWLARPGEL